MTFPKTTWADGDIWNGAAVNDLEQRVADGIAPTITAINYSSSITPALPFADGIYNIGTLTGDMLINNPSGTPYDGQEITFRLTQDGTGGHAVTFGNAFIFGTDVTAATLPIAAAASYELLFRWNGTKWRALAIARGF